MCENMKENLIPWLLQGPSWVRYRTRLDLLEEKEGDREVKKSRSEMKEDPQLNNLLTELGSWPGEPLTSHKSAGHLLHKLVFIADLGFKASDPELKPVIKKIRDLQSPEGPFQVLMKIPVHFGGTGNEQMAWAFCDSPSILYSLLKMGAKEDASLKEAGSTFLKSATNQGWTCTVSRNLGKFRGPGRKSDPCPYATLVILKALSQREEWKESEACKKGSEALLSLWEKRRESHPFQFYMGTDFCKLKAPFVWYDLLHVVEVLSHFPDLKKDWRLKEMVQMIEKKSDPEGKFVPESVWQPWKGWDFGQKKEPSYWLTFLVLRIKKRLSS
jgi:hypothetical protein